MRAEQVDRLVRGVVLAPAGVVAVEPQPQRGRVGLGRQLDVVALVEVVRVDAVRGEEPALDRDQRRRADDLGAVLDARGDG